MKELLENETQLPDFINEGLSGMHYYLDRFVCGNELSGVFENDGRYFRYSIYEGGEKKVVEYSKDEDGVFHYMRIVSDEFI